MKQKILLIEPPFYRLFKDSFTLDKHPLSLGYLSGEIKKNTNWDVMSYNADFNLNRSNIEPIKVSYLTGDGFCNYQKALTDYSNTIWDEIRSVILDYKPAVVGISVKSQNFLSATIVAKIAKEVNADTIVIIGGPHSSMVGADIMRCQDIDICVKGEGERTIVELLSKLEMESELSEVKGIIYRESGKIIENPAREFIENLDTLCFPYQYAQQTLKDFDKYPLAAFGYVFAVRGCPYNCFFCGSREIWSRKVRYRSAENVVSEIVDLHNAGVQLIHFDDDTFGVNKQYLGELCKTIMLRCPGIEWSCELHVKLVDDDSVNLMKKSGCYKIMLGIESGNEEILKKIRKNITIQDILLACKIIKKNRIKLHAFFIIGFPWDTEETIQETIEVVKKIKSECLIYSIFTPYPGTEAHEFCKRNGLISDDSDLLHYYHQCPDNYFCPEISPARFRVLVDQVARMVDRINFTKKNVLQRIAAIFSLSKLRKALKLGPKESFNRILRILIGK